MRRRVIRGGGNYFDRLSDDVVIHIVDRLNLKDAAKTSILSQRFHTLWKLLIPNKRNLDFQGLKSSELEKIVNGVMRGHRGTSVDSLTIAISKPYKSFNNWLEFARTKCVANLEMAFTRWTTPDFPLHGWEAITSLTLRSFQMRKGPLEEGLKNSLINLESLLIDYAFELRTFRVSSQSLKRLEVRNCICLHCIKIDFAPNLHFYKIMDCVVWGSSQMHIKEGAVPKLSYVCLDAHCIGYHLLHLDNTGVEKLELYVRPIAFSWMSEESYPRLRNLKELVLRFRIEPWSCFFLEVLSLILPACPQLQKLEFYYSWANELYSPTSPGWYESQRVQLRARSRVHECLKVVKFGDWIGWENEVEAVNLAKEIAPNLNKIIYG